MPTHPSYALSSVRFRSPPTRRFRVAFSFAGEKREFVEQVAALLAVRFGEDKILYDHYHEAVFARYDLGICLPMLYGEQSDLIVPVLCPAYDAKCWTSGSTSMACLRKPMGTA